MNSAPTTPRENVVPFRIGTPATQAPPGVVRQPTLLRPNGEVMHNMLQNINPEL